MGWLDMKYAHKLFGVFQRLHRATNTRHRSRPRHRAAGHSPARGRVWVEASLDRGCDILFYLERRNKTMKRKKKRRNIDC